MLKCDFHLHVKGDPRDNIQHNYEELIDLAHKNNFSEQNIKDLVRESGFEIMYSYYNNYHSNWMSPGDKPWDLGMILKPTNKQVKQRLFSRDREHTIDDVYKLYRKGLALAPSKNILRYSVDRIEQFFQTLRIEERKVIIPKSKNDFITFESI